MGKQKLSASLKQKLTAKLRHSLSIVRMNQIELAQHILNELSENPFLEEKSPPQESLDALNYYSSSENAPDKNRKGDFLEQRLEVVISLTENLLVQLHLMKIPQRLLPLLEQIVTGLNSFGFAISPHFETGRQMGYSSREIKDARAFLKKLEPTGVAAEDMWESLIWQLEEHTNDPVLVDIIEILRVNSGSIHSLDDTEIHKLAYLVGLEKKSLIQKLDILRSLQMFPIASIDNRETQRIIPEVFYFNSGNTVNISIRSTFLPELSLNTELLSYGREQLNHEWLERYEQAKNLLKSIDYRYSTLTQVAEAILIRQQAFFIHGESALVPLRQQEVAEMVGIHVSTVSRIITSKYCDTKWGIFPLRYFFPSAIARERGDVTVLQLKKDITTALASEDSGAPLSDSQLQTKLQQAGYKIERRTVAKYRKLLHILSAKQRKAINSK